MEKKLVEKMIKNCFKQYYEGDSLPVGNQEMDELVKRILRMKHEEPTSDIYEVINDMVYEFLTG